MKKVFKQFFRNIIEEPLLKTWLEEELANHKQLNMKHEGSESLSKSLNLSCLQVVKEKKQCRIYLPDYNNVEIKIDGIQAKTLYVFYLLCPFGVSNADLYQYKKYLIQIYREIFTYEVYDEYRAQENIKSLLSRKGGVSEATSKIRKGVKKAIASDMIVNHYCIEGEYMGERYILLPKHKISVENSLSLEKIRLELINLK